MHDAINLICRDAYSQRLSCYIQDFSTHSTRMAKARITVQLFCRVHTNVFVTRLVVLLRLGSSVWVIGIVWFSDMGGNLTAWAQKGWLKTSGKRELLGPVGKGEFHFGRSVQWTRDTVLAGRVVCAVNKKVG